MRSKILIVGCGAGMAFLLATNPVVAQAAGFITSGDIVNNTIKSKDVKDNGLKGKDVKDNSLEGGDINESTLGVVPNSTNLNGQPSSTYLTNAQTFNLTFTANDTAASWPMGLASGQYLVNWQASLTTANDTGHVLCALNRAANDDYVAGQFMDINAFNVNAMSGGGTVTVTSPSEWTFFCTSFNGAGNMSLVAPQSIEVTFQQLSSNPVTSQAGRPARAGQGAGTR